LVKACDSVEHSVRAVQKGTREFRVKAGVEPKEILEHEDLAIASGAGANANGRDVQGAGDLLREAGRDTFENHGEGAELLESAGAGADIARGLVAPALDAEPSVSADGLGLKAEMSHDRNAALDKTLDYVFVAVDAFNFYGDGSRG